MPDSESGISVGRCDSRRSGRDSSPAARSDLYPERSPTPNSVKAFAEARQRGREHSISESPRLEKRDSKRHATDTQGGFVPDRALGSTRSYRARPHTTDRHSESPATSTSTEDDVRDDGLSIDFDCLETLTRSETREQPVTHAFATLAPESTTTSHIPMVTTDGDFVNVPSWAAMRSEKEGVPRGGLGNTPKVARPNRFSFFSSARDSSIHAAEFSDLLLPGEDVRQLFSVPKGTTGGVWWLHMNNPTGEEVRAICAAFGIHPLTLEDINTQESREKIELFRSYYFASFRSFISVEEPDGTDFDPLSMYLVVFREGAITFSFAPETHASRVRLRISRMKEHVSLSSDWICYALIDDIVDSFYPVIEQIEHEADTIEDQIFITRPNDHQEFLRRMGRARTQLMSLMRLLGGKADVLRAFAKRCNPDSDVTPRMEMGLYLGDVQDHVVTMMNGLVQSERMLSRCHSSYLAQVSLGNIDQGNRTLKFLSRVTVVGSVLVPLNLVCLLFGMNVNVPWKRADNIHAWLGIISGIVFVALVAMLVAKRIRVI